MSIAKFNVTKICIECLLKNLFVCVVSRKRKYSPPPPFPIFQLAYYSRHLERSAHENRAKNKTWLFLKGPQSCVLLRKYKPFPPHLSTLRNVEMPLLSEIEPPLIWQLHHLPHYLRAKLLTPSLLVVENRTKTHEFLITPTASKSMGKVG